MATRYVISVPAGAGITLDRAVELVGLSRRMADIAAPGLAVPYISIKAGHNEWGINTPFFDAEITPDIAAGQSPYLPLPPLKLPADTTIIWSQPGASGIAGIGVAAVPAGWELELVARLLDDKEVIKPHKMVIYSVNSGIMAAGATVSTSAVVQRPFRLYYTVGLGRMGIAPNYTVLADHGVLARVRFRHYATTNAAHYAHLRAWGTRERPMDWGGEPMPGAPIIVDFQNTNAAPASRIATMLFMGLEET